MSAVTDNFSDGDFFVVGPVICLPAAVPHADNLHSFKCRLEKLHFLVCALVIDNVMLFRSGFTHEGH